MHVEQRIVVQCCQFLPINAHCCTMLPIVAHWSGLVWKVWKSIGEKLNGPIRTFLATNLCPHLLLHKVEGIHMSLIMTIDVDQGANWQLSNCWTTPKSQFLCVGRVGIGGRTKSGSRKTCGSALSHLLLRLSIDAHSSSVLLHWNLESSSCLS